MLVGLDVPWIWNTPRRWVCGITPNCAKCGYTDDSWVHDTRNPERHAYMTHWVRTELKKLCEELKAETPGWKDPDVILTAVDPYYRDDVYIGDLIHPSSEFDE